MAPNGVPRKGNRSFRRWELRNHAKTMATIIGKSNISLSDLENVYVQATVLLMVDGRPDMTDFWCRVGYCHDASRIPSYRLNDITDFYDQIAKAIPGNARLRVHQVNPYQDEAAREEESEKRFSNAYRTVVAHTSPHVNVLAALDHAHRYEVIHRNLTPDIILVTEGG